MHIVFEHDLSLKAIVSLSYSLKQDDRYCLQHGLFSKIQYRKTTKKDVIVLTLWPLITKCLRRGEAVYDGLKKVII